MNRIIKKRKENKKINIKDVNLLIVFLSKSIGLLRDLSNLFFQIFVRSDVRIEFIALFIPKRRKGLDAEMALDLAEDH